MTARDHAPTGMQDYMINWNVGPLGLVLRPDLGDDMPPVVVQVLPGESVASLAGVAVGDMLVTVNGKRTNKMGYEKSMRLLYKQKLPIVLHFRIPQFKPMAAVPLMPNGTDGGYYHNQPQHPQHAQTQYQHLQPQQRAAPPHYNQQHHQRQLLLQHQQQQQQQQQHQQQQQQQQGPQPLLPQQQRQPLGTGGQPGSGGNRSARTLSILSNNGETREQKLRKQFSAVWESGSLGFSFRPYAPNVNIPTVDFIGARGEGKNMDQVCVNDVLIAINGDKTKSMGVERVLKILHVLEKPVVLRFHKSSHRISPPTPARSRRRSGAKLPSVAELQGESSLGFLGEKVGLDEEPVPSVRFALDDQIQLRSETPRVPPPPSKAAPPSILVAHTDPAPPSPPTPQRPSTEQNHSDQYTSRIAHPETSEHDDEVSLPASPSLLQHRFAPPTSPVAPPPVSATESMPRDRHRRDSPPVSTSHEPAPVPISIAGTYPPSSRSATTFSIPLEHAIEIVANSNGKAVEDCHFGGLPLLQIREGSMQARLLVTFAKACLAKQMKEMKEQEARAEEEATATANQYQHQQDYHQQQQRKQPMFQHVRHSTSSGRPSTSAVLASVPSNATTFAGNSLAPGRPKYLTYSFRQTNGNLTSTARQSHQQILALPAPPLAHDNDPHGLNGNSNDMVDMHAHDRTADQWQTVVTSRSSSDHVRRSSDHVGRHDAESTYHENAYRNDLETSLSPPNPSQAVDRSTSATLAEHHAASEMIPMMPRTSERSDPAGLSLTLSQLRVSGKHSGSEIDPEMREKLKDLGEIAPTREKELSKRVTEMIALDSLLELRVTETNLGDAPVQVVPEESEQDAAALVEERSASESESDEKAQPESEDVAPTDLREVVAKEAVVDVHDDALDVVLEEEEEELIEHVADEVEEAKAALARVNVHPDHPIIQQLCAESRDLERVMVGHSVERILTKKLVIEEIQDILNSLEMELQFERHSHVGFGRGSLLAPPERSCSRCGKSGNLADLALDGDRRELYCQDCWEVFFFSESVSPNTSGQPLSAPEQDTPTHFDPYEYSLHDSGVNVAFEPWHSASDSASERDSNVTAASSITEHADEVWL